ncbi:MAG TPA: DUF6429 family protein [Gammaproteobacteria bacterium]|nr:DUF6429 family protein [Gammaproteobacteria bacterium]
MQYDKDKADEIVLALLYLGIHDGSRTWKGIDWDSMNRLHQKGFISNPINKTKSVMLTDAGEKMSEQLFKQFFAKQP